MQTMVFMLSFRAIALHDLFIYFFCQCHTSCVAKSDTHQGHCEARSSLWAFVPFLRLFLWSFCGVAVHIVLLGDQCHGGVFDLQRCVGVWFVSFGNHINRIMVFPSEYCTVMRLPIIFIFNFSGFGSNQYQLLVYVNVFKIGSAQWGRQQFKWKMRRANQRLLVCNQYVLIRRPERITFNQLPVIFLLSDYYRCSEILQ